MLTTIWLMKSEPNEMSIDLAWNHPDRKILWFGVRNYQARNFMRDQMKPGHRVLFYHSSCPKPGIVGLASVFSTAVPDPTQFVLSSPYYDAKSTPENPRWHCVWIKIEARTECLSLSEIRHLPGLENMPLLARGNRLSITPVQDSEWQIIQKCLRYR